MYIFYVCVHMYVYLETGPITSYFLASISHETLLWNMLWFMLLKMIFKSLILMF